MSIFIQGYLKKESLYLKQFRKRWIILKGNKLYSFKNKDDKYNNNKATEIVDLNIYDVIQKSSSNNFKFTILSSKKSNCPRLFGCKFYD